MPSEARGRVQPGVCAAPVTILTSGVGLGVYVPALLNLRDLRAAGHDADAEVLEGLYGESQLARHLAHRDAFRDNFKLALLANRMPRDVLDGLDPLRVEALLGRWARQGRTRFLVWSGFWLPLLERYHERVPQLPLALDLCRIDAAVSASFRLQRPPSFAAWREIWLWNGAERRLDWQIPVLPGPAAPIPCDARAERLVVHGGGWAIGTFAQVLPELARAGLGLDVLAPDAPAWPGRSARDRHFAPDADWHPWQRDANAELTFPALREVRAGVSTPWLPNESFPSAHTLVRTALAIVSKPGGGTLIDSLAAATPVVLLEPYGEAEAKSGELWQELGFGIPYDQWRASGFDRGVLTRLHHNLLEARRKQTLRHYPVHDFVAEDARWGEP